MPHYITLVKFTDEGVKNMNAFRKQMEAADAKIQAAGGKVTRYFTLGEYDVVVVAEAPDDEAAAKISMGVSSQGHVRLKTMRAFTQDEFLKML